MKALTIVFALSALTLASACSSTSKARKAETLPVQTSDDSSASADQGDQMAQTDQNDLAEEPDRAELESAVYFDFDSATLSDSARAKLSENAAWLQQNSDAKLLIEGHTDEVGTDEYNIALGQQRAQAAYDFLIRLGVDPDRLATMSYGEEQPADPGRDSLNRRSEFKPRGEVN